MLSNEDITKKSIKNNVMTKHSPSSGSLLEFFRNDTLPWIFSEEGPDDITSSPISYAASKVQRERSPTLRCTTPRTMARSPALLLLLSLGLCCTSAQGRRDAVVVRFLHRNTNNPQEGQRLEMECSPKNIDNGASWIRQDKDGKLHFIVYISMLSRTTYSGNENTSPNFEASRKGNSYRLVVKNFRAQDQGTYFCIANINQVLHFSSGQPAFFPAEHIAPAATIQSSQVTTKDNSQQGQDAGTSSKNTLNSICEVFLWVRVAGTCLLLLTAIIITIVLCQNQTFPC
eukprot:XP_015141439.1 T-cell surface glycoprotein CD8 alpha chain-like isoform X4 [Gallus gallus]